MKTAKAKYVSGRAGLCDFVRIGNKEFSFSSLVEMWNRVPDDIRKKIVDERAGDY
ncbi:MAG: hypothetical protein IMZ64_08660 [Bacteroidetes bacterium]|nr:hypothetical protein [Bacteroidota bacterium]